VKVTLTGRASFGPSLEADHHLSCDLLAVTDRPRAGVPLALRKLLRGLSPARLYMQVLELVWGSLGLQIFIRQQTAQFYRQCQEEHLTRQATGGYEPLPLKED
jgi:hypothetical protein